MTKFLNIALLLLIGFSVYACRQKNNLPIYSNWPTVTLQEPKQTPTQRAPFEVAVKGQTYTITPLFNYEISGLVVSCHFSKMLAEYRNDDLNIMDAGILWGSNLDPAIYTTIKFHNNGVFLHFEPAGLEICPKFDMNRVSNNHLLCTNPQINKRIKTLRRGELITIKGCLATYKQQNGWYRGSSTVRTDQGNGACETVWVEELTILESCNENWNRIYKVSLSAFGGLILLRMICFVVVAHRMAKPQSPTALRSSDTSD